MARDVHKVLLQIIVMQGRTTQDEAELLLKGLETQGRYQKDVWVTWPGASAKEWGHQVLGNCAIRDTVKYIELYLIDLFFFICTWVHVLIYLKKDFCDTVSNLFYIYGIKYFNYWNALKFLV